jgi:hypothetical protein
VRGRSADRRDERSRLILTYSSAIIVVSWQKFSFRVLSKNEDVVVKILKSPTGGVEEPLSPGIHVTRK